MERIRIAQTHLSPPKEQSVSLLASLPHQLRDATHGGARSKILFKKQAVASQICHDSCDYSQSGAEGDDFCGVDAS